LPRSHPWRADNRRFHRDADHPPRGRSRRDGGAPRAAVDQAADGGSLHLLRPDGACGVPDRPGDRRASASAHQPRDRHLSLRRPDPAPRQPWHGPRHRTWGGELDEGRTRHRPFGTNERRAPADRPAPLRHPDLGSAARGAGGKRPGIRPPRRRGPAGDRRGRHDGAAHRGDGLRGALAARHRLGDTLCRCPARAGCKLHGRAIRYRARALHHLGRDRGGGAKLRARPTSGAAAGRPDHRPRRDGRPSHAVRRRADGGAALVWWNFVSSRKERIEQAQEEWRRGRFDTVPGDEADFIPLPETNTKPRRALGGVFYP